MQPVVVAIAPDQAELRLEVVEQPHFPGIVGDSDAMRDVVQMVDRVASTDATVLVTGETGTGKELVSRAIHNASRRSESPFVAVNLAAVPETLIESELFGHEAGSFTGARGSRRGRLEAAEGGTLFLDEVGDLPMSVQVKLLRVLQDGQFERVGDNKTRHADFRLVCATHRDLEERVREGNFREDLFYRLDVIRMHLPSLRERLADLQALATHFVALYAAKMHRRDAHLTPAALDVLRSYSWPGNIRELQHTIERAVVLCEENGIIGPELVQPRPPRKRVVPLAREGIAEGRGLDAVLLDMERMILSETMERFAGNQSAAASHLKLNRQTLRYRLRKCGLG